MIGSTLSHFRIDSKLGEGGMGVVWGAEDTDLHRRVALKVLSDETMAREDMRARFLREARTAAALNHPNICTIYEVGEVDQVPFIAMELIEGTGLDSRLGAGEQLPLKELLQIAVQIADGLAAAHAGGIVHRDLKPGNVMLTDDGQVKILDFGLAKPETTLIGGEGDETLEQPISAEMTREGTILGTVAYMSPEQAAGRAVDSRSDVFSFGVLLYQMVTGQLPFRGDTSTSTLAKILETEAEPVSDIRQGLPSDLERVLRRCLQKEPNARYNDTRDLVAELRDLQTTGESQAVTPVRTEGESKKIPAWVWAAMAVVAIVAAIYFIGPFRKTAEEAAAPTVAIAEKPSVAVLPFHNLSADEDNAYFSAGITEEIISKLSRIDGLEVASRSSVAAFTDPARDVQQIGRDLGVRYLLDGSVRRAGEQVRVSAQLVDGTTGRNLWSEDFDGSLEDVFAMQEQTALKIAERLDLELSPEEERDVQRQLTDNVAAYDAYLQGMAMSRNWGVREGLDAAGKKFEQALELDPNFAAAMAGWATVESDLYRNFDTDEERMRHAEELAERAVQIDPTIADASHALGLIAGNRFDYDRAVRLLGESVRLDPKEPRFWDNLSWALAYQTPPDGDRAVEAAREAIRLQPIFPGAYYHLGRGLIAQGKYEEAREAFETSMEQNPSFGSGHLGLAQVDIATGEWDSALKQIELSEEKGTAIVLYYQAAALAGKGEIDQALEALEGALQLDYRDFANLDASPYFETLRQDPRFTELIQRYRN
jgi:TolB-like protein/Tfp pilus assembly protein PilF